MKAWAWYSAEYSFVYVRRIARLGSPGAGKRHPVDGVRAVQEPGYDTVFTFVNRRRRRLPAHRSVDSLDSDLSGEGGRVRLPGRDRTLAGLAGSRRRVEGLANCLVDDLGRQTKERPGPRCHGWPEVGDVVDPMSVQGDPSAEVDLDLVGR